MERLVLPAMARQSTPTIGPSTNLSFASGDSGSALGIFPGNASAEPDGTLVITTTVDFTTPVFAFGFDIVDLFDHGSVPDADTDPTFDDSYEVLVDGNAIYRLVGQSLGASQYGNRYDRR